MDAGPGVDAGGGTDAGPACVDDTIPDDCAMAEMLGVVDVGGSTTATGKIPVLSDSDWFVVQFPPLSMPGELGGGTPTLTLEGDSTMVFEVRASCEATVTCGEGVPRELTSYTFTDDQSAMEVNPEDMRDPDVEDYRVREVAWPSELYVRVSRRGGPVDCSDYTLTVTR